jgi:hypothetical protein
MGFDYMMKWHSRDIIDLEYFFHQDVVSRSAEGQEDLHERDRNIYLNSIVPSLKENETPARQLIIKTWLNQRREERQSNTVALPGESYESLYGSFRFIFLIAGLVLGGVLGASFLTYTGDSPVNVFVYLSVFIFLQLLLLLFLFVLSLYRLYKRSFLSSSLLYTLISKFMIRMLVSAKNQVAKKMSADQGLQVKFVFGTVISKTRTYGFLFFLPIFILTQLFAMGFNLGLLAATLFKVITADIAFGWQSTIQLSPEAVYSLVQKIALPWSWAVQGDIAFPSLAQIEGSRIILKEGIFHLSTPNLVSWWPFLCLAVLVYGLLPRLFLFLAAVFVQRRYLDSLDFRQGTCEQLLQRMATPLVTTHGSTVNDFSAAEQETVPGYSAPIHSSLDGRVGAKNLLIMIPDELYDSCPREEIESVVNKGTFFVIQEVLRINQDYASDKELLVSLSNRERMVETDILIIQEAWQPPIMEYIDFIKQLRQALGDGPCIRIGLIGKPQKDTIFTPVKDENRKIWDQKITAIGDPCIYAEGLVHNAA